MTFSAMPTIQTAVNGKNTT